MIEYYECDFINDGYNKNGYFFLLNLLERSGPHWIFKLKPSGMFLEHFGLDFIDCIRVV